MTRFTSISARLHRLGLVRKVVKASALLSIHAALAGLSFGQQPAPVAPADNAVSGTWGVGAQVCGNLSIPLAGSGRVCYGTDGLRANWTASPGGENSYRSGQDSTGSYTFETPGFPTPYGRLSGSLEQDPQTGEQTYSAALSQGLRAPVPGIPIAANISEEVFARYRPGSESAQNVPQRNVATPTPIAAPAQGPTADQERRVFEQVRNDSNVYNNPFAQNPGVGSSRPSDNQHVYYTYDNSAPRTPYSGTTQPTMGTPSGMTQDQFRASVNQSMDRFRQADAQFRQSQATSMVPTAPANSTSGSQLVFDDNAPRNSYVPQISQVYAPRNGYDSQGYRTDSSRPHYDSQGYRTDSTSTRPQYDSQGYRTDSTSTRPQYDAQGYRTDSTRPTAAPAQPNANGYTWDSNGPRTAGSAQPNAQALAPGQAASGGRLTFNENAPRGAASVDPNNFNGGRSYGQPNFPSQTPTVPTVTPRQYGTASPTAALQFAGE